MKKPENPPAFPDSSPENHDASIGMSLRDYFAAKAMSAFLSKPLSVYKNPENMIEIANQSYEMADAMLKARKDSSPD